MEILQEYNAFLVEDKDEPVVIHDENLIKKLYPDTNRSVRSIVYERKISFENNVLILKKNLFVRTRRKGKKYFSKRFISKYLKFDLTTGNFLTVDSGGTSKSRRNSTIRVNSFHKLHEFFDRKFSVYWNNWDVNQFLPNHSAVEFDNKPIYSILNEIFGHDPVDTRGFYTAVVNKFSELKRIKLPNDGYENYLMNFYPTEKYLKKNDRKLVQSMLDMLSINDKFTNKLIHKFPNINLYFLSALHYLLGGSRHLSAISDKVFLSMSETYNSSYGKWGCLQVRNMSLHLTNKEKSNLIKLLNEWGELQDITTIIDHFVMISKIRKYDPSVSMRACTHRTFTREHYELSVMVSKIRKGYSIKYEMDQEMVQDIESPFTSKGVVYTPYILKDEKDYFEEGKTMKHCVASYSDKETSIIVSVRDSKDQRVTCEFDTTYGDLIQAKSFQNKKPQPELKEIVDSVIQSKIDHWIYHGKLKMTKVKVPVVLNGVEVEMSEDLMDLPF